MANNRIKISTKKLGKITLTDTDYIARGGEGTVYVQKNTAYKIYHDPLKMIPIAKIQELSVLQDIPEIIRPDEVIFDENMKAIGYTMSYIDKVEFLCKMFTKNFRDGHNISPVNVMELVTRMQKILSEVHKREIIVGDYNEMNFLLDSKLKVPYHIDVDSWQTKNFKGTAIMPSVQDMTRKLGDFDQLTDWYSWAVVTFQLYMGIHPYKGRHPNYMPKEFIKRIEDKVSVFNKDTELPLSCQDFSVIPKVQLDWYREVFEKGYRGIPPLADGTFVAIAKVARIYKGNDTFETSIFYKHFNDDFKIANISEVLYIYNDNIIINIKDNITYKINEHILALIDVKGKDPLYIIRDGDYIVFKDFNKNEIGRDIATQYFICNGTCYTIYNTKLFEHTFIQQKNLLHGINKISMVNALTVKAYDGIAIDDIFGQYRLIVPHGTGTCYEISIPELTGETIISAKYSAKTCIIITRAKNVYNRFIINLSSDLKRYFVKKDEDVDLHDLSFVVLPNGLTINCFSDEKVEIFQRVSEQIHEVTKPPFNSSNGLFNVGMKLLYKKDNTIVHCSLKK